MATQDKPREKHMQPTPPAQHKPSSPPPLPPRLVNEAKKEDAKPAEVKPAEVKPAEVKTDEPKLDAKPAAPAVEVKRVFTDPSGPLPAEPPPVREPAAVAPAAAELDKAVKKTLTREEQKALFDAVFAELDAIAKAEADIVAAAARRTVAVEALVAGMNGKLGTWKVRGRHYRVRRRGEGSFFVPVENMDVMDFDD
jgi:hypothetical protein